ncbi:hypothetical protein HUB94_15540 [Paenibacillus cellulosilyticus]|nr:hypothetical protein HUB94_15540 [Paenibacillus cellulosilyticus]
MILTKEQFAAGNCSFVMFIGYIFILKHNSAIIASACCGSSFKLLAENLSNADVSQI